MRRCKLRKYLEMSIFGQVFMFLAFRSVGKRLEFRGMRKQPAQSWNGNGVDLDHTKIWKTGTVVLEPGSGRLKQVIVRRDVKGLKRAKGTVRETRENILGSNIPPKTHKTT